MASEALVPEVISSESEAPRISVVVDLVPTGVDQYEIRVKYPTGKRLIVLGMLEDAKFRLQMQDPGTTG